ncbi:MAG: RAMP superfamily CRISPR-associated protein [Thermoplasmata archaeon]
MFEKLERRIVVKYKIKTISDLHIGIGAPTVPNSVDLPVIKNAEGIPIIPGSSLKGVLRAEMQKLLNTQFGDSEIKVDDKEVKKADVHVAELFGGEIVDNNKLRSVAGSIRVRDAKTESKKTRIRDGVKIDINTRKAAGGAKFEIEVVPAGTVFNGEIYIENPGLGKNGEYKYGKLGALLSTIRFFNATTRAIGGGTSRGFGEVEIEVEKVKEFRPEHYLNGKIEGEDVGEDRQKKAIEEWKNYVLGEVKKDGV